MLLHGWRAGPGPPPRVTRAKGVVVSQIYGLTEASTLFWLPTQEARDKMGSVGHPIFHGRVRIIDEQGNR